MCVADILEAIERIESYTAGITFDAFAADRMRVDAVVRNIGIIGEAAGQIPLDVQKRYPGVPWADMRGMRNVVIHQYFGVLLSVLWPTIREDLPAVATLLEEILAQEP